MRYARLLSSILILIFLVSCSNVRPNIESKDETMPPDPFPVELSSRLSILDINANEQDTTLKLSITVNRNYEYHSNVKVDFIVLETNVSTQMEITKKKLFDNEIELYVKKTITEETHLTRYGKYIIKIEANYSSHGQNKRYLVDFDKDGVSILQEF
ncbi:hypothetical protein Back11_57880 [Paenibacillus baekrokdamisoli]|uniref:Uncharacterized protein n=1 Tax=Paenibacillus baekrokdamisoli TaxID=1712516 RepID=A0A3G9JHJ4_9BACL|nr:hypothetical protein [Paenibacillus baekrokdamisoli]MBB3072885.1 hypothetical protein [Paenibacillus baekrokdamisoli]BBH24443.1 hypothetical protein Back11_57880 [Paenibacillus baekrokdamisoli]